MVKKIDYHKGPVTAVQLTSQDVLVTGTYIGIFIYIYDITLYIGLIQNYDSKFTIFGNIN